MGSGRDSVSTMPYDFWGKWFDFPETAFMCRRR